MSAERAPWLKEDGICPCCGAAAFECTFVSPDRFFGKSRLFPFAACRECRSIALAPKAGSWSVADAYPSAYPQHGRIERLRWYHSVFASYFFPLPPRDTGEPVMEIGCGTGLYLEYLSRRYHAVMGVEMDPAAVEVARAAGRHVQRGEWETFDVELASTGVLVMNQVLEHLVSPPCDVFRRIREVLRPGGCCVIRTPNSASWGRRQFGEYWHPLEVPRHTVIYSPAAIRILAGQADLRVERLAFAGRAYDITQSAYYRARDGRRRWFDVVMGGRMPARILAMCLNTVGKGDCMEVVLRRPSMD